MHHQQRQLNNVKDELSLNKKMHIHLYFLATQYLGKYALVEDMGN